MTEQEKMPLVQDDLDWILWCLQYVIRENTLGGGIVESIHNKLYSFYMHDNRMIQEYILEKVVYDPAAGQTD